MEYVQVVDLAPFLANKPAKEDCARILSSFQKTGILIVRDPRITHDLNNEFLDMIEKYFSQSTEVKMKDVRKELHYQVGATPSFTEKPRDWSKKKFSKGNEPTPPTGKDCKWRWFHPIGELPKDTKFKRLNDTTVVPKGFPQWNKVMDRWGGFMIGAIETVTEMLALGMDLPKNAISDYLKAAPHLLAPTACDLTKFAKVGTVVAGLHTDLNLITIHSKSRYPGLNAWLRDGTKFRVKVPDGCLLLQAGQQLEHLTGGLIEAGFHEVVIQEATLETLKKRQAEGAIPWRISSTLFGHGASDKTLEVLDKFKTKENVAKYPPILTGDHVLKELKTIALNVIDDEE